MGWPIFLALKSALHDRYFDEVCDKVVCQSCVVLSHHGHKCITLPQAAGKYRNKMGIFVDKANTYAKEIRDVATQVRLVNEELEESFEREQAAINTTFEQVRLLWMLLQ